MDSSNLEILTSPVARKLLGHEIRIDEERLPFPLDVITHLEFLLRNPSNREALFRVGLAALNAFVQANVTGPPLSFSSEEVIFPRAYHGQLEWRLDLRRALRDSLAVEGVAVYHLTPHIELFWLAKQILNHEAINNISESKRTRARVNFTHQKLLLEHTDSLESQITADYESLEPVIVGLNDERSYGQGRLVSFYIERAVFRTYHGRDAKARQDLVHAADLNGFEFRLTGRLGKRTQFQDKDISQLVVIAKSSDTEPRVEAAGEGSERISQPSGSSRSFAKPIDLNLNDDTLLENISFAKPSLNESFLPYIQGAEELPPSLTSINPEEQPLLKPLDAIILLNLASSISNTNPQDGLTREETLPYATRALQGGSSSWQVYTQALLVRSRIESYKSRTAERGLLQLQALVDQVIIETKGATAENLQTEAITPTFIPRPRASETASADERLKYVWQLDFTLRWELEAELAARWVHMGGLRTALEIYERLQMWAEAALCLAATEEEAKAVRMIRKLVYEPSASESNKPREEQAFYGKKKPGLPADAPRLLCILGDLEKNPRHYEEAWSVSEGRYARAQSSLGRHFMQANQYQEAADAYSRCLRLNQLSVPTWFALGCIQLELKEWPKAVESFTRVIQLEDGDAEAWSNLAVALLRLPPSPQPSIGRDAPLADEDGSTTPMQDIKDPHKHRKDALLTLRRAATLKYSDPRIWDNYLTVAASIPPPDTPYSDIILAQKRVIELRAKSVGDKAVDKSVLSMLIQHVTSTVDYPDQQIPTDADRPEISVYPGGLARQLINLVDLDIVPIITASPRLWLLVARLADWRRRPLDALDAREKAWRLVTAKPGVYDTEEGWNAVVGATVDLVQAYRKHGQTFKAKSAIRGVKGKGKDNWEGSRGWERLVALEN